MLPTCYDCTYSTPSQSLPLSPASAIFLIIHGSHDLRPAQALQQLVARSQARLPASYLIGGGQLECSDLPLDQQILQFAHQAASQGIQHLQLVPLFLLPGVHVKVDLPATIAIATPQLPAGMNLTSSTYLGAHPGLATYLAQRVQQQPYTHRIILAHGSKRPGGHQPITVLAKQLQATPAFWSVEPSLTTVVAQLIEAGAKQIGIFPYFLFPGSLADAMIQKVDQLRQQFVTCDFWLDHPFDVSDQLVGIILELAQVVGSELLLV